MRIALLTGLLAGLLFVVGCGASTTSELVPVSGTVTLDSKPAGHAEVTFTPEGDTKGNGGTGRADESGKYEVSTPQGQKGLHPGKYKVVITRMLHADGSPMRADEVPIETQARETLPAIYSNPEKSILQAEVTAGKPVDFPLTTKKK